MEYTINPKASNTKENRAKVAHKMFDERRNKTVNSAAPSYHDEVFRMLSQPTGVGALIIHRVPVPPPIAVTGDNNDPKISIFLVQRLMRR